MKMGTQIAQMLPLSEARGLKSEVRTVILWLFVQLHTPSNLPPSCAQREAISGALHFMSATSLP